MYHNKVTAQDLIGHIEKHGLIENRLISKNNPTMQKELIMERFLNLKKWKLLFVLLCFLTSVKYNTCSAQNKYENFGPHAAYAITWQNKASLWYAVGPIQSLQIASKEEKEALAKVFNSGSAILMGECGKYKVYYLGVDYESHDLDVLKYIRKYGYSCNWPTSSPPKLGDKNDQGSNTSEIQSGESSKNKNQFYSMTISSGDNQNITNSSTTSDQTRSNTSVSNPYTTNNSSNLKREQAQQQNHIEYERRRQQRMAQMRTEYSRRQTELTQEAVQEIANIGTMLANHWAAQNEKNRLTKELNEPVREYYKEQEKLLQKEIDKIKGGDFKVLNEHDSRYYSEWKEYYEESIELLYEWEDYECDQNSAKVWNDHNDRTRKPRYKTLPKPSVQLTNMNSFNHIDYYNSAKYNKYKNSSFAKELIKQALYLQPRNINYNLLYSKLLKGDEEIRILNYILSIDPNNKVANNRIHKLKTSQTLAPLIKKFRIAYDNNDYKNGIAFAEEIETNPDWRLTYNEKSFYREKAYLLYLADRCKESTEVINKVLRLNPSEYEKFQCYYRIMFNAKKDNDNSNTRYYAQAIINLSKENKNLIDKKYVYSSAQQYYYAKGNTPEQVKENFKHVLSLCKNDTQSLIYFETNKILFYIFSNSSEYTESIKYINNILVNIPAKSNSEAYQEWKKAFMSKHMLYAFKTTQMYLGGWYKDLIDNEEFYLAKTSESFESKQQTYIYLYHSALKLNKKRKANKYIKEFVKETKEEQTIRYYSFSGKRQEERLDFWSQCYAHYPNSFYPNYILALAYKSSEDYEKAISYLKKSVEIKPDNYDSNYWCGIINLQLKKYDVASVYFKKAISIYPKNKYANYWGGKAFLRSGKAQISHEYFLRCIELEKEKISIFTPFSFAHLGNSEKAISSMQVFKNAKDLDYDLNFAGLYSILGKNSKAIEHLQKALNSGCRNFEYIDNNPDFENLRNTKAFKTLVNKFRKQDDL